MDQWLAQIYGTGGAEDLEKTAQALSLQKLAALAEQEGVDLSQFTEEELQQLAEEVVPQETQGEFAAQEQVAQEPEVSEEEMLAKEAQAKFEEADFLGRVMAHSFHQESNAIEMEKMASTVSMPNVAAHLAAGKAAHLGSFGKQVERGVGAAKELAGKVGDKLKSGAEGAKSVGKRYGELMAGGKSNAAGERAGNHLLRVAKDGNKAAKHEGLKSLGARVGTGAAAVGAGALAHHAMSGKSEKTAAAAVLDQLAEQRALDILEENGIDPNAQQAAGQGGEAQDEPVSDEQQLEEAVEKRAYAMLAANGYIRQ